MTVVLPTPPFWFRTATVRIAVIVTHGPDTGIVRETPGADGTIWSPMSTVH